MVYVLKEKLERIRLSKLGTRGPARMLPQRIFRLGNAISCRRCPQDISNKHIPRKIQQLVVYFTHL